MPTKAKTGTHCAVVFFGYFRKESTDLSTRFSTTNFFDC
jgi:hypothetical protein